MTKSEFYRKIKATKNVMNRSKLIINLQPNKEVQSFFNFHLCFVERKRKKNIKRFWTKPFRLRLQTNLADEFS